MIPIIRKRESPLCHYTRFAQYTQMRAKRMIGGNFRKKSKFFDFSVFQQKLAFTDFEKKGTIRTRKRKRTPYSEKN